MEYDTYQVELVTMGDPELLEAVARETPVVAPAPERPPEPEPEPEPPPPDPEPEIVEPEPEPEVTPEPEPEPPPTPRPETPPTIEQPPVTAETTAAEMNVRMEGLRRDFPQYYQNIVVQMDRCFRETPGLAGTAILRFQIQRDGTIPRSSISVYQPSVNRTLDILAVGAVECVGQGRLGPLPEDMPNEVLPVQFTFSPSGSGE
jgi:hypothetical protein